jgi:hypothetical protein
VEVRHIDAGRQNPLDASEQELLAYALDDAGLLRAETLIDGRPAREFLDAFYGKREIFRESTRLGALLVTRGVLNRAQLSVALEQQRQCGKRIGEVVLRLGYCRPEDLERVITAQLRMREDIDDLESLRAQIAAARTRLNARL